MHDILIIDDIVDKATQDIIEKEIFSSSTQWIFGRTVYSHSDPLLDSEAKKHAMNFTKSLYRMDDNFLVDNIGLYTKPLDNLNITRLITSRIQLYLPVITDKLHGSPHVDGVRDFPFKAAVYYVNDSEGDTFFFKETTKQISPDKIPKDLEIVQTISPKKGRLIVFNGDIYHASGKPKKDVKCIINYNFI